MESSQSQSSASSSAAASSAAHLVSQFDPDLILQFKHKISSSDWEALENYLTEERTLGHLKKKLFEKFGAAQARLELEWEQLDVREKSQLVGELQEHLYELQLVEHALKVPLIGIAKIMFSLNPDRCVEKDPIQAKSKAPKRRKHELGVLTANESVEEPNKIVPVREAKLLAFSQVHRHQQDERLEELTLEVGKKAPGRLKRRPTRLAKNPSIEMSTPPPNVGWTDKEEETQQPHGTVIDQQQNMVEGDLNMNNHQLTLQMPSPTTTLKAEDGQSSVLGSPPPRVDSANISSNSQPAMSSPPGTRSRKKGGAAAAGTTSDANNSAVGGRSPRKRGADKQRHASGGNGKEQSKNCEDDEQQQQEAVPADEPNEPTYCLCEQVSFGEMICCDYELCSVEWFHFACVNIKSKPKGKKWYCPLCRHNEKANTLKPELQQKFEQIRHRTQ